LSHFVKGGQRGILINPKKKIGLALSGGGARGFAHVGVLDVLKKEGVPIDFIAGTSIGAIIGSVYAATLNTDIVKRDALDIDWNKLANFIDLSFPKSGLIKGDKFEKMIAGFLGGNLRFDDLKIPFACVATDIDTGEEVVMDSGSVADAVRASVSMPGVFAVVERDNRFLVDGGITTPVPVEIVKDMGANFIIAVNINPNVTQRLSKSSQKRLQERKEPNIIQVIMQSFYITSYMVAQNSLAGADIIIEPDVAHIRPTDFQKAAEMIMIGQAAATDVMPQIKRKLKGL
jgi:NTE family protein